MPLSYSAVPPAASRPPQLRQLTLGTVTALCLFAGLGAQAQSRFEEEFDDTEKPWQEITLQIPATPQAENLMSFDVSVIATQKFAVDANSVSVGSDGVVRYTLVASSALGAQSISYEGIRCQSFEKKLYAFGHKDGKWSRARRSQWEPIYNNSLNAQHATLAREYFCSGRTVGGEAKEIVARLRSQRPIRQ